VPTTKKAISKNHFKDILRDKNHLYRIVLVHLTSNDTFKTRKHLINSSKELKKAIRNQMKDVICHGNFDVGFARGTKVRYSRVLAKL